MKIKSISILINVLLVFNSHALCQDSTGFKKSNYELKIELPKYTYKKYEPVIAKIDVINNDNKPLDIYNLFISHYKETTVLIKDDIGNSYDKNNNPLEATIVTRKPKYRIQPGETLSISMPINDWGMQSKRNEWYFSQFGYFPVNRNFTAYLYIDKYRHDFKETELRSNEVGFEVVDLDFQDSVLLKMEISDIFNMNINIEEIKTRFSDNIFTEHIIAEQLRKYWLFMWGDKFDSENLVKDFENFINKYPNSYYILEIRFITPYFMKLANRNIDKIEEGISSAKNNFTNGLMFELLNSKVMVQSIKEMLIDYIEAGQKLDK